MATPRGWQQGCVWGLHTGMPRSGENRRDSSKCMSSLQGCLECLPPKSSTLCWKFLSSPSYLGRSDPIPNMSSYNKTSPNPDRNSHHFMVLNHQGGHGSYQTFLMVSNCLMLLAKQKQSSMGYWWSFFGFSSQRTKFEFNSRREKSF